MIRENIQMAFLLHERGDMQRKDRTCAESQYVFFVESLPVPSEVPFEMPDPILSFQNAVDEGDVCVLPEVGGYQRSIRQEENDLYSNINAAFQVDMW